MNEYESESIDEIVRGTPWQCCECEKWFYLACYDEDNESLPFPIKITKTTDYCYEELPASEGDPDQGF